MSGKLQFVEQFLIIMTPAALSLVTVSCNIGVRIETRFVEIYQFCAFGLAQFVTLNSLRYQASKSVMEQAALVTGAPHGFTHSGATNHFFDEIAILVNVNLRFVRGAEEVVIV